MTFICFNIVFPSYYNLSRFQCVCRKAKHYFLEKLWTHKKCHRPWRQGYWCSKYSTTQNQHPIWKQTFKKRMKMVELFKLKAMHHNLIAIDVLHLVYNVIFSVSNWNTIPLASHINPNSVTLYTLTSTWVTYNIHVLTLFNIFMSPPYVTKATITSVLSLLAALCIGVSPF